MKKVFAINAAVCDARKVQEETLAGYDEIRINSAMILVSPESQALLSKYPVSMNVSSVLEMEGDVSVVTINGMHTLQPGDAIPQGRRYLMVNGMMEVTPGCEEQLKSYAGFTVNGVVTCPKSLAGYFASAQINGKLETYPDGCIRLKNTTILDKSFPLRAKEGARYYAAGRVVALAGDVDVDALAAKGVSFVTKKLLVAESLCGKVVPLFDEEAEIIILPDGCAYVNDDATLDKNLLDRYGDKLYINGDLRVNSESKDVLVLDKVSFLKVNGNLRTTRETAAACAGLKAEYGKLKIVADKVISEREELTVDRAMLETVKSLSIEECTRVIFEQDVPVDLIREKIVSIEECGTLVCSREQRSAIELVAVEVGHIHEPGQEPQESEEEQEDREDQEEVRKVNAATYIL